MSNHNNNAIDNLFRQIVQKDGGELKHFVRFLIGKRQVIYRDLLWEIKPADNHTDYTMWLTGSGGEDEELSHLATLMEGEDIIFVDIGANIGLYSLYISSVTGPKTRIFSFEPNPKMRTRLERNIALNNISNIEIFPYAVGAKRCNLSLNFPSRWNSGEASIVLKPRKKSKSITVPVYPLIDVLPENTKVDLIKIDIEGAEDQALIPYLEAQPAELLPRHIFLEHAHANCWKRNLDTYLINAGYEKKYKTGSNSLYCL